jgi:hypothetical protein
MRVEEERVHTPREWLDPSIQKLESRRRREFATVLVLDVLDVGNVLSFRIVNPSNTNSDLKMGRLGKEEKSQNIPAGTQT